QDRFEIKPVIGDECAGLAPPLPIIEQRQRQQRLAGPRRAAQDEAGRAENEAGGMNVVARHQRRGVSAGRRGSRTVNMAPDRSVRFSARMLPLWASMIWREMARPSPEWLPKPSLSGRSV